MTFDPSELKYNFKEFVGIYENSFTKKECDNIITLFEKYHSLKYSYNRIHENLNNKNDSSITIDPTIELDCNEEFISNFHSRFYDYIYPLYNNQYPALQNLRKHRSRHIKIQKTFPTQGYHVWHCEHDAGLHDRILSWILYLNDVEEGGETEFLYQSLRFKPRAGTFILFPAHFTHTHRGNPPLSGVKYIATGWIEFLRTMDRQGPSDLPNLNKIEQSKKISYQ
jgi:hypothetical protein